MADWVWGHIDSFASFWMFAALFALLLIFLFALFPLTKRHLGGIPTLDSNKWGFSVADANETLGRMTDDQLRTYRRQELLTDMLFPIVYSLMFATGIALLLRTVNAPRWLVLLPFIAAIADYAENLSIVTMIGRRLKGQELGPAASIGSLASRVKYFLLVAIFVLLVVLGAWALWQRYRG